MVEPARYFEKGCLIGHWTAQLGTVEPTAAAPAAPATDPVEAGFTEICFYINNIIIY